MQTIKKGFLLFLSLVLLSCLCGSSVFAIESISGNVAVRGTPQTPDLTGGIVTGFAFEDIFATFELESYEKGDLDDLYFLIETIGKALDCTILMPDQQEISALCTAKWNTDELPLDVGGIYQVTATLTPPEGCTFADGVRREIIVPVQIIDPEDSDVLITAIDNWIPNSLAIAVPVGGSVETMTNHLDLEDLTISGTDENGSRQRSTVEWDFSAVTMDLPGLYTVKATPKPPPGLSYAPELVLPEPVLTVSVQTPGRPDINTYSRGKGAFLFPWLLSEEQKAQLDLFDVWMAVDGVWSKNETGSMVFEEYLRIGFTKLSAGTTYQLQVDYPGGQTGILTFTYDGKLLDSDYNGGDRDGSDGDGMNPPDVVQPPPTPDEGGSGNGGSDTVPPVSTPDLAPDPIPEPATAPTPPPIADQAPVLSQDGGWHTDTGAAAPETGKQASAVETFSSSSSTNEKRDFLEETTATSTTISGRRLQMMLEEEGGLQFSKQGISVTLSPESIAALNLADDDIFSIEIMRISDMVFYFWVRVNENSVTTLTNTAVSLPYTASAESPILTLQHSETESVTTGSYDAQSCLASFVVDSAGYYTILTADVPAAAPPADTAQTNRAAAPVLAAVIAVCCLFILTGGTLIWRRKSVK